MKEYSIKLRLTATEAEQLVKAAAHHDQKVSELLESFVYDLVSSDEHRGGDDETAAAHQWYQRRNEALYPHHATPLTESESLKLAKTEIQKRCIQEAFRYTPLYFEWIKATMVEDGVIMEDQDHGAYTFLSIHIILSNLTVDTETAVMTCSAFVHMKRSRGRKWKLAYAAIRKNINRNYSITCENVSNNCQNKTTVSTMCR